MFWTVTRMNISAFDYVYESFCISSITSFLSMTFQHCVHNTSTRAHNNTLSISLTHICNHLLLFNYVYIIYLKDAFCKWLGAVCWTAHSNPFCERALSSWWYFTSASHSDVTWTHTSSVLRTIHWMEPLSMWHCKSWTARSPRSVDMYTKKEWAITVIACWMHFQSLKTFTTACIIVSA